MNKSGIAGQVISHPQGGGAVKGLGESFSPDLHTGTGNLSVPIAIPPARNGIQPDLSLVYSSGQGNGIFGLGWTLSIPGIARDTSKGLPVYSDADDAFVLSGAEQLVPIRPLGDAMLYRPRTEGLFARILHHATGDDDYWEVRSRNGLKSLYGHSGARRVDAAVVRDPDDAGRVLSWHLTETTDPFGNRIEYLYERDTAVRDGARRWDQIYLSTIRYADYGAKDAPQFLVTVDFVYEPRPDPFSSYRGGFEVRTTRRCTRIEIRTHADAVRLTRVFNLIYQDQLQRAPAPSSNGVSLLSRIQVEGVDGDVREALPPLDFGYTAFEPVRRIYQPVSAVGESVPERSLAHPDFELADLFGRGLPDLVQIGDVNRYWRNLGEGRFDLPRALDGLPAGVHLGDQGTHLADFDGDGQVDLLVSQRGLNGYCPLIVAGRDRARPFVSYVAAPPFALDDPQLRLMDLDGDGVTDALRTGTQLELYFHDPDLGWTHAETRTRDDFDRFPDVYFSDPRVKLADMTGDGLQDIVFVSDGSVCYWPYMGNGRWGGRISMSGRIAFPDGLAYGGLGFDPRRVLLGDVDGDGMSDLVYVESGRLTIWLNQCGNGWSDPIVVNGTPPVTDVDAVRLVDFLGRGTAGILWTYDAGTFADSTYKFLDLSGGTKPYLLNERVNNVGARTLVEYVPSTRFYLEDERRPSTRWSSRLPFPVQVVARVEVIDELSNGKLTTEYRYHQGYWDGGEREFRGFGVVDQLDTETFAAYHAAGLHGQQTFTTVDAIHFSPPTLTRTWFHQGQVQDGQGSWSESTWQAPWAGDPPLLTPDLRVELTRIVRAAALTADPARSRDAMRALRGSVLRGELYALDDSANRDRPYTVTESQYDVREIEADEPDASTRLRIFFPFRIASRTTQWERGSDPMTQIAFTGGYDDYGLPRTQLALAVPRGRDPRVAVEAVSEPYLSTYTVTEYARRDDDGHYLIDRTARTTGYEVLNDGRPSALGLRDATLAGTSQTRLVAHARTFYDGDAFVGLLVGQLGEFGAAVRSETLAFADGFLDSTFDSRDTAAIGARPCYLNSAGPAVWTAEYPADFRSALPDLAGYVHYADGDVPGSPGGYFIASERRRYDFQEAGAVTRGLGLVTRDPLGADVVIQYDTYDLLAIRVTDPAGLVTEAAYDYRTLQASRITDPNGNTAEFSFSPSGLLTAQYVRGKNGEGDIDNPSVRIEYNLLAFVDRGKPVFVRSTRRVHHDSETDVAPGERNATIESIEYSDGFGRLLQTRTQAEDVLFGDAVFGGGALAADQSAANPPLSGRIRGPADPLNTVVSGWQVYDNKGRVVEKYEPFFAQGWDYLAPVDAQFGQKAVMFYDPRGQIVRTLNPDGSEQLVIFGVPPDLTDPSSYAPTAWEAYTYDANDNAGRTHHDASSAYSNHWNTPASIAVDALGRTVAAVARNGSDSADWLTTRSTYDIQGNLLAITDALGRAAFRYLYDLAKRRWRMDGIDTGRRDSVPDALGNPVETRDSKGALTLQCCDLLRRPSRLWARDSSTDPVAVRQILTYGDAGSPDQSATDRAAARAANLLGQLASCHDEAGLVTIASIDFKGNVLEKSRRMIADAPMLAVFDQAQAGSWQVAPFRTDWQPGAGQSLADREAVLLEAVSYQTSASYDALGRIKQMRLPQDVEGNRRTLLPSYNPAGGLEKVFLDGTLYVERIAYDAKGQRALVAYGNGVMTRYAYDPRTFRPTRLRSERYTKTDAATYASAGDALQDFGYAYDLAGNILSISDRTPGSGIVNNPDAAGADDPVLAQLLIGGNALLRGFRYDPVYRLLSATGRECDTPPDGPPWLDVPRCADVTKARAYTETYAYDAMGSMLELRHQNPSGAYVRDFAVESASNRLRTMQIGETVYAYAFDANGNMVSETTSRHFDWGHGDQMKAFRTQTDGAEPSVYAQYLYDSAGQRVKKLVRRQGGQIEVTHYIDATFEHHRWSSGSSAGENNCVHVMDDKQRIALVRVGPAQEGDAAPAVQFQLGDHLGSSNVVVDVAGALVNREEFLPYGETSFGSFAKKRYRFTGMERDEESGLVLCGARYFLPHAARWTTCDPVGPADGNNLYRYARCNPIIFTDASGLGAQTVSGTTEGVDYGQGSVSEDDPNLTWDQKQGTWLLNDPDTGGWVKWQGGAWTEDTSQYTFVEGTAPPPEDEGGIGHALSFGSGILHSAGTLVKGAYNTVRHPVQTAEGLYQVVRHPINSATAIGRAVKNKVTAVLSGDYEAAGELAGDIAAIVLAPEAEGAEIAKGTDIVADVAEISKVNRAPILADTDLLVHAFGGSSGPLSEIRSGTTYITTIQNSEFLNVQEFSARSQFLLDEGIVTYENPQKYFFTQAGPEIWEIIDEVVGNKHGFGDAILAATSKVTGIEAVTLEKSLPNFFMLSRQGKFGVNIRRAQR